MKEIARLEGEIKRLNEELADAQWQLAHYRDMHLLACGASARQLTLISSVLKLEALKEAQR